MISINGVNNLANKFMQTGVKDTVNNNTVSSILDHTLATNIAATYSSQWSQSSIWAIVLYSKTSIAKFVTFCLQVY